MAIADKLNLLRTTKAGIKAAIEEKGQPVGDAPFSAYPEKILAIETGTPLPELENPGTAGDLLAGEQLIGSDGQVITGTMPEVEQAEPSVSVGDDGMITATATQEAGHVSGGTKTATHQLAVKAEADVTVDGPSVTAPAGYYPAEVVKTIPPIVQATPSIVVGTNGLITATAEQAAGYVAAGSKSATQQLATKSAEVIRPGTSVKTAVASGVYTTGAVTVEGSAALLPENIKSGVSIFGVNGSYSGGGKPNLFSIPTTTSMSISGVRVTIPIGIAIKQIYSLTLNSIIISGTVSGGFPLSNILYTSLFFPVDRSPTGSVDGGTAITTASNGLGLIFTAKVSGTSIILDFGPDSESTIYLSSLTTFRSNSIIPTTGSVFYI